MKFIGCGHPHKIWALRIPIRAWGHQLSKSLQGAILLTQMATVYVIYYWSFRWMKFSGCGHPLKTLSIEGTNRSMRSPIVMGTHPSCINVETSTGCLDVQSYLHKWPPSMLHSVVVVTPTKLSVEGTDQSMRSPIVMGIHPSCINVHQL